MKAIKIDLPRDMESAEIHTFADLHIGDKFCDKELIRQRVECVKNTPTAYCVLNGDIMNNATKTSVSDSYAEEYSPMQQLEMFTELFDPIKDRILAITPGNHENRTYTKEGVDLTAVAAKQLGLIDRYSKTGAAIFIKIGNHHIPKRGGGYKGKPSPIVYSLYVIHGSGGGRKEGAKAIRLADMASVIDTDIYIHAHTHLPMVMKQAFFRTDMSNGVVKKVDKLFVNTSAQLEYGGYGEAFEYKPSSKECPVIYISGVTKSFSAKL